MDIDKVKKANELSSLIIANRANIELIKTSDCITFATENRSDDDNVTLMPGDTTSDIINAAKDAAVKYIEGKVAEWEKKLDALFE